MNLVRAAGGSLVLVHSEIPGQPSKAFETDLLAAAQLDFDSLVDSKRIVGSFELKDVIQNCKCEILLTPDEGKEWAKQQWDVGATVCPDVSDAIDLGNLKVPEIR